MAALTEGLPMVIVPIAADQPENAERCAALGVARVIWPAELSAEAAREAVRTGLADPSYRAAAARMRAEIAGLPGPERAAELQERLASKRAPLTAG